MDGGRHVLVLGGQRSGKSRFAEELVLRSGLRPVYLATAAAGDSEMSERIADHRRRRGPGWTTLEEPLDLNHRLREVGAPDRVVLVDCLTLWLGNLLAAGRDAATEAAGLADALATLPAPAVLVSGEVGSGVIPANPLARQFADALGQLNQTVAAAVGRVVLVVAGQPVLLKPSETLDIRL